MAKKKDEGIMIRMPTELKEKAMEVAEENDEILLDVVRKLLKEYISRKK